MGVFDIAFESLHIVGMTDNIVKVHPDDRDVWETLSPETHEIIAAVYFGVSYRFERYRNDKIVIDAVRKSVFGLCVPEGYILLKAGTDSALLSAVLDGFLVRSDGNLRAAWHMARWQQLLLCAAGWKYSGKVSLSLSQINEKAETALDTVMKIDSDRRQGNRYFDHLQEIGKDMTEASMPFSFAMTDGSIKKHIRLDFGAGYREAEVSSTGTGEIPIAEIDERHFTKVARERYPFDSVYLDNMTVKEYIDGMIAQTELVSKEEAREKKAELKEDRKNGRFYKDSVWCFVFGCYGHTFMYMLDIAVFFQLYDTGSINYGYLFTGFTQASNQANAYFARLEAKLKETPEKSEDEKTGFFANLFKK